LAKKGDKQLGVKFSLGKDRERKCRNGSPSKGLGGRKRIKRGGLSVQKSNPEKQRKS